MGIQNNIFNLSCINTVIVCILTSNLRGAKAPGNVLLEATETNLPDKSVVHISQIFTVNKLQLAEKIGTVSEERVSQILEGVKLLIETCEVE